MVGLNPFRNRFIKRMTLAVVMLAAGISATTDVDAKDPTRSTTTVSIDGSYNFRRISDQLTTSGVVGANRLTNLKAQGYEALINLLPDGTEHAVPGEAELVTGQGLTYVHIPVDFSAPTDADFAAFVQAMDAAGDKTIHVHCAANFRVSAFYALYAMHKGLWTPQQAEEHIRGIWNPADYPAWQRFIELQRQRITR